MAAKHDGESKSLIVAARQGLRKLAQISHSIEELRVGETLGAPLGVCLYRRTMHECSPPQFVGGSPLAIAASTQNRFVQPQSSFCGIHAPIAIFRKVQFRLFGRGSNRAGFS